VQLSVTLMSLSASKSHTSKPLIANRKNTMKYIFILISLLTAAALVVSQSTDVDVNLTWSAPTTRTDGSVLTASEIVHYEIYCTNGKTATVTTTNHTFSYSRLTESGEQSCSVSVGASDGDDRFVIMSEPATESFVIPSLFATPSPATNLTITVG